MRGCRVDFDVSNRHAPFCVSLSADTPYAPFCVSLSADTSQQSNPRCSQSNVQYEDKRKVNTISVARLCHRSRRRILGKLCRIWTRRCADGSFTFGSILISRRLRSQLQEKRSFPSFPTKTVKFKSQYFGHKMQASVFSKTHYRKVFHR